MILVDSHCHLDDAQFDGDREAVIGRALEAGVGCMLAIGSGDGPPDLEAAVRLADSHEAIYATVGVHPHEARKAGAGTWTRMEALLGHPKVVAVGEIGLDYHYNFSAPECQRAVFVEQLQLAGRAGKPVIVHTREAWDDTLELVRRHWAGYGLPGVMHCFSGGPEEAALCLEMGFYISFAGVVTFPKAVRVQAAARVVPADRLLVETDAPYLAPQSRRGRRNEPAYVAETAARLAELRGEPLEEVAAATTANFRRLCLPDRSSSG